jgi:hypothetical protein
VNRKLHILVAFFLACNYFAFQVELFDEEYEENHSQSTGLDGPAISPSSLSWETFDKENAPKAFTIEPVFQLQCLFPFFATDQRVADPIIPYFVIRDKSPPLFPQA